MKNPLSLIRSIGLFKKRPRRTILESGELIWKFSVVLLLVMMMAVLAFDGYLFILVRHYGESIDIQEKSPPPRQTLEKAPDILKKRADLLENSVKDLPTKDPFR